MNIFSFILLPLIALTYIQIMLNHAARDEEKYYIYGRIENENKRYVTFLGALEILKDRNAKILHETGTARDGVRNFTYDGGSTIIFADWAYHNDAILYSVDINPGAVESAKEATQQYSTNSHVICEDSIKFLKEFNQPIDFLYLDSYDFDFNNPNPSQEHHLRELVAAYPKLHQQSIVMIDDLIRM